MSSKILSWGHADDAQSRKAWKQSKLSKKTQSIGFMSSNLWATSGPIDLGIHLQRNKHGEQVVVAVDKGSPAAQEGGSRRKPGSTMPAACSAAESSAATSACMCPLPPCDRHPVPSPAV